MSRLHWKASNLKWRPTVSSAIVCRLAVGSPVSMGFDCFVVTGELRIQNVYLQERNWSIRCHRDRNVCNAYDYFETKWHIQLYQRATIHCRQDRDREWECPMVSVFRCFAKRFAQFGVMHGPCGIQTKIRNFLWFSRAPGGTWNANVFAFYPYIHSYVATVLNFH